MSSADRAVWAIVALIFALPALALVVGDPPTRFGFQMYSGYGRVDATWIDAGGQAHPVQLSDHVGSARREIDWTIDLPRQLCARIPEATSVAIRQTARGADKFGRATC